MELDNEKKCIINNRCPRCGTQLEYCKGINNFTDYLGCPRHNLCGYKGYPANAAIMLLRLYISSQRSNGSDGVNQDGTGLRK